MSERSVRDNGYIPDKGQQVVRHYGWFSNKSRGQRRKSIELEEEGGDEAQVIVVSDYEPRSPPSKI